jgi:hypothetical protein
MNDNSNDIFSPEQAARIEQLVQQRIEGPDSQRETISAAFKTAGINFQFSQDQILKVVAGELEVNDDGTAWVNDVDLSAFLKYVATKHPELVRPPEKAELVEGGATTARILAKGDLKNVHEKSLYITSKGFSKFAALPLRRGKVALPNSQQEFNKLSPEQRNTVIADHGKPFASKLPKK